MLKRFAAILLVLICFCVIPTHTSAVSIGTSDSIIYLDDGSYITMTFEETTTRASGTTTGHRNLTYTANDGTVCWKATLTATFTYNGTSATCTASNCSVTVYESNWYTVSKSAAKSGNTATATVTMGRKVLGITIDKDTYSMTISCDKDGNMS